MPRQHCWGYRRVYHQNLKMAALASYGSVCSCCGESEPVFLSIDHVGDGAEHRRSEKLSSGQNTYAWLKRNGYPEGFEVLCHNCNHGRQINGGTCPHQEMMLRLVRCG